MAGVALAQASSQCARAHPKGVGDALGRGIAVGQRGGDPLPHLVGEGSGLRRLGAPPAYERYYRDPNGFGLIPEAEYDAKRPA